MNSTAGSQRAESIQQPIIIIGAARSGTKLLRKIVASHRGVDAIPYDINYIWRLCGHSRRDDVLEASDLTERARKVVVRYFGSFVTSPGNIVVEKTVGNCFRIPLVSAVFPEAHFIHIIRDGRDVAASARRQWQASPKFSDLLPKMRTFPWWAARGYAVSYLASNLTRLLSRDRSVSSWGPVYPGMMEDARRMDLVQVCAKQWAASVSYARAGLEEIPDSRRSEVRYEDLVVGPRAAVMESIDKIGLEPLAEDADVFREVMESSVGKWKRDLSEREMIQVKPFLETELKAWGYRIV